MRVEPITESDDGRLGDYRHLKDAAERRRIEGDEFFIAEGPIAIERLLASPHRVRSLLLSNDKFERLAPLIESTMLTASETMATRHDVPVYVVERDLLHDIVGFDLHRGAIAAADRRPPISLDVLASTCRRLVVLEGLNDPENLGAIARSARALGVDGLICDPTCIDPYTRRTVRVSQGEILHLPFTRIGADDWPGALGSLHQAGWETWALTPARDALDIWSVPVPPRLALVLGAEGPGLTKQAMQITTRRVMIPINGEVDSLNVGNAAAVACAIVNRTGRSEQG